jgi:2-oxoisovalerate ferredoxin oxidoreductase beta subunit
MVKLKKPESFYKTFERKGAGEVTTHYCPGCGHGNIHKIIAEVIEDLAIQDRTVFLSPVGCSAFAYYYFDTGNVACAHGRAPAVGTGISRSLDDSVVISYQGDGDLAGIGTAEIIHAANRGENMAVIFVNNAIYGMTGGQMAPTTLIGQKTSTTPKGRNLLSEGGPIHMSEMINDTELPLFIERVSLADASRVLKARKAIRKAIRNCAEGRGFSFVEVLSPCPVGWKMNPMDARKWIKNSLEQVFPVRNFRDRTAVNSSQPQSDHTDETEREKSGASVGTVENLVFDLLDLKKDFVVPRRETPLEDQLVKIAGFGGQGVMSAGILLANCAIAEGGEATWLPSYGPEMRGGTANAGVVISHSTIGSPVVDEPSVLLVMNGPSLDTFEETVQPNGLIIVDSSMVTKKVTRKDVQTMYVPATEMAKETGFQRGANIILLTVYLLKSGVVRLDTLKSIIPISIKRKEFVDVNIKLTEVAKRFYEREL